MTLWQTLRLRDPIIIMLRYVLKYQCKFCRIWLSGNAFAPPMNETRVLVGGLPVNAQFDTEDELMGLATNLPYQEAILDMDET